MIITAETAKHRVFGFQDLPFCPDHKLYAICSDDALLLGVLSSQVHTAWALRAGGTLEDRPTWTNTTTFLPFPFPSEDTGLTPMLATRIRGLAEQIDAQRKKTQSQHSDVTLTGLYNVLAKLREHEPLSAKEARLHELGLVAVLKSLHEDLDEAVLSAYGWSDLHLPADTDILLDRLSALNSVRVLEEADGKVRPLRAQPSTAAALQTTIKVEAPTVEAAAVRLHKQPWPTSLPEQIKAIAEVLSEQKAPADLEAIAARFTARGRWRERLPTILESLEALGRARQPRPGQWIGG